MDLFNLSTREHEERDVDHESIKAIGISNAVVRRRDGCIRRFHRYTWADIDGTLYQILKETFTVKKAIAKENKWIQTKHHVVEHKQTRRGWVPRKAVDWEWKRP